MASNQLTPLDRMRRYAASLQDSGRTEEDFVSVRLGDLTNLVLRLDVLREDHSRCGVPTTQEPECGCGREECEICHPVNCLKITLPTEAAVKKDELATHRRHQIRTILAECDGFDPGKLEPHDYRNQTERLLKLIELQADEDEDESAALREDLEDLQNQNQDLTEKLAKAEKELKRQQELVHSLRYNGARHWFAFGWDKPVINGSQYVRFCKTCEKEEDHPAHFSSEARYLDSRDVEKATRESLERVCALLAGRVKMSKQLARMTALGLLRGLPGIATVPLQDEPEPEPEEKPEFPGDVLCNCGAPKSNHPYRHPFDPSPPNGLPEGVR